MDVYLDHAATTPLDPKVRQYLFKLMEEVNGNPSSIHKYGREARQKLEDARKTIAGHLGADPNEICFTSSGTEADNMALLSAIRQHGTRSVLSSPIEHHAVHHTLEVLAGLGEIDLTYIPLDKTGHPDLNFLESWLKDHPEGLVSIMHANNEIGNLVDLNEIGSLCHTHDALFHTDTVQTIGYVDFNLSQMPVDYLVGSAHKFYGPKGVGFLYHRSGCKVAPMIHGGGQEKLRRGGTENVHGICAMAYALDLMESQREEFKPRMQQLKQQLYQRIRSEIPEAKCNGDPGGASHYTVVNVTLPEFEGQALFFARLDQAGVAASGGSACAGGGKSHVIDQLRPDAEGVTVRLSIGKHTTETEIEYAVEKIRDIVGVAKHASV